jgi:hypothetical protein
MAAKIRIILTVAIGLIFGALIVSPNARAIEVKKELVSPGGGGGGGGGGGAAASAGPQRTNPIPAAMRQQLADTLANESDDYLNQESDKKSSGKNYVDLEPKFTYLPTQKGGKWTVLATLEGNEYKPPKNGEGKGRKTGARKQLIFNYRLDGSKWTEVEPPKWQDAPGTATAAKSK